MIVGVLTHDADEDYERGAELIAQGAPMELVTVVVVPARDEQDRIGACLEALAAQTVGRHRVRDDPRRRRMPRPNRAGGA